MRLGVHIGNERVGEISVTSNEQIEFRFTDTYRARHPRPVLGQVFEDDLDRVHRSRVRLPPFFSNLLPEGALRALLATQIGVRAEREPELLAHVGDDLSGNVRVTADDMTVDDEIEPSEPNDSPDVLKFSLAGVQLKLSAFRTDRGLTIPAHGRGGEWIVKLPDPRFAGVPELEWSMMTFAREAGLDVADVELVPINAIEGLPAGIEIAPGVNGLAVRRFDRRPNGRRIHMEDFAQVLDVRTVEKYKAANFETIARVVARVAPASITEFIERLVFIVAIGNGDAHLKNWSLLYEDGIRPALSPGYDLLSTIEYLPDDDLGLNLAKSKRFEDVTMESLLRLARKAELEVDVEQIAQGAVAKIRDGWTRIARDLPIGDSERATIEKHWAKVPLLK